MSQPSTPRVSVVMPVYNGATYLDEAIESVLQQDFADFEFVIVDDGSRDRTPEILASWAARDPRIVLLRNDVNRGISHALNVGLAAARGEYIARQDADDIAMQGRFTLEVELLDRERDVVLVSMNYEVITEDGVVIERARVSRPEVLIRWRFLFSNAIGGHGQVMFRRSVVQELGGYSEDARWAEDYELWTRMLTRGRIVVLPQIGMRYRMHGSRSSEIWGTEQKFSGGRIAQRALQNLLQRDVDEGEAHAVRHLWGLHLQRNRAAVAHRTMREAYAVFTRNLPPSDATLIRRKCAAQFIYVGALMLSRGAVGEMLTHFRYGLAWNVAGALGGCVEAFDAMRMFVWRRMRR
ncbi:MAG TPA: glycosyltransferase [Thermoanaerobaculia bacterium]|jgi:glycosyltransferase involved in cell wall biosynthesis